MSDQETIDPRTGEITRAEITTDNPRIGSQRAANGDIVPTVAHTAGGFVDLMEDGAYSEEVHEKLRQLAAQMTDISNATGQKTSGKVTLEIFLSKEGDAFQIRGEVKVKSPELPRPKSVMWSDDSGNF